MARKMDPLHLNNAIDLYLAGQPMQEITSSTGVSTSLLHRERTRRGIPPRRTRDLPTDQIAAAYQGGASVLALSKQYGVSRGVIADRLTGAGVQLRAQSAAAHLRAADMTPAQRKAQAAAANRAARMRRVPQIDKLRRALEAERGGQAASDGEAQLRRLLQERGYDSTPQRAVGACNVDLAVLPVAVEVLGGGWHVRKAEHADRIPYILDEGWHLVMVWDHEGRSALGAGAADYLVSFVEEVRRNPPATCQYRVISGQGETLAARGREEDEFPLVPPPRGA